MNLCAICGEPYEGMGHNPEPLKSYEERVCTDCNANTIIPARMALWEKK